MKFLVVVLIGAAIAIVSLSAAPKLKKGKPSGGPISELTGILPDRHAFKKGSPSPIKVSDGKQLAKYFSGSAAAQLKKKVDFKNQVVVVIAWHGSSRDKISYDVAESYPEQVVFSYQRGKTKDLRPHSKVYVLRNNVSYSLKR